MDNTNNTRVMDAKPHYEPRVIENFIAGGVLAKTVAHGGDGVMITKQFMTSLDKDFNLIAGSMLRPFVSKEPGTSLNSLLVIITPDNKAHIYDNFPFGINIIVKRDMQAFQGVRLKDIADIRSVIFKDDVIDLTPQTGDKVIWLFRENWVFGLFFDLSKTLDSTTILEELGFYYKRVAYLSEYRFLEDPTYFNAMISEGWFPFIALMSDGIEYIQRYYEDGKTNPDEITALLESFDKKRLDEITSRWWNNSVFAEKRTILQAGINSYLSATEDGYINAIKNLVTELEGLIRVAYHRELGKNPTTKELKEYITQRGKTHFSAVDSLCFPDRFLDYLNVYIFKGFDLTAGDIPGSRHSVAHGVAQDSTYSQEFALKLILALDNVYYFFSR